MSGDYLRDRKLYLSGPIEHDGDYNWRIEPKKILSQEFGLDVFDPFDDPKQQWTNLILDARNNHDYDQMALISKKFVQKDLTIVDNSNLLIANLPYKVPTCGTHHEIIRASDAKKPVLLVCEQGKEKIPLWFYGFIPHQVMFGNWDELYEYLRQVNDDKHRENRRWHYIYGMI